MPSSSISCTTNKHIQKRGYTFYDYKNRFTTRKKKNKKQQQQQQNANQLTDILLTHRIYKTSINDNVCVCAFFLYITVL